MVTGFSLLQHGITSAMLSNKGTSLVRLVRTPRSIDEPSGMLKRFEPGEQVIRILGRRRHAVGDARSQEFEHLFGSNRLHR